MQVTHRLPTKKVSGEEMSVYEEKKLTKNISGLETSHNSCVQYIFARSIEATVLVDIFLLLKRHNLSV